MGNDPPKLPVAIARIPRAQTATQRDLDGLAAKRKREAERATAAAAVPEFVPGDGDITQQYGGDELELARRRAELRSTDERIAHLEMKNDVLQAQLLKRADESVAFGRSLALKIITAILSAIAIATTAYFAGKHGA